jgi:hypothetical protein
LAMEDLFVVAGTLAFFGLAFVYARACERL